MSRILAIDPGVATGASLGTFGSTDPYQRTHAWQIQGGLDGFLTWWRSEEIMGLELGEGEGEGDVIVSEQFILRNNAFVANTEPLRIEGAMIALGMNPVFQDRTKKALVKDDVLKEHGLWLTGKQVGWTDARDTLDSTIHALAYLKRHKHIPTLRHYWA